MRTTFLAIGFLAFCMTSCNQDTSPQSAVPETENKDVPHSTAAAGPSTAAETVSDVADGQTEPPVVSIPEPKLSAEELDAGWIQLFDGQTLFGWQANSDANWSVVNGVIQSDSGTPGLLLTKVPFNNFELRCDFRLEKGGNSGIFLRSAFDPKDPTKECYELNICDSHNSFKTGSFVGRKAIDKPIPTEGQWSSFHVIADGPKFVVELNDAAVLDFTDTSDAVLPSGLIGLQKKTGKIEFRNVFVRPLGTTPLFNGKDLTGWHEVPGCQSILNVEDGCIHVKNGPGFLETDQAYANFILRADAITFGEELNSGIFFRSMVGTKEAPSNGYEMQIHNGCENGDRTKPNNAGTGAIFRRNTARWIVANDNEWFTTTLIANDLTFAVWVNGLQVTDWTDDRAANENPRRGSRREAGRFILQGHDATTDLAFRNLTIVTLP